MLKTMLGVDSACWFIVLCVAGWWLKRKPQQANGRPEGKHDIPVAFWVFCACLLLPLACIIHVVEGAKSLLCYKHVVKTVFGATKEASA
jgi:hypothetical protein